MELNQFVSSLPQVSRTPFKLQNVAADIESKYKGIKTKIIDADFRWLLFNQLKVVLLLGPVLYLHNGIGREVWLYGWPIIIVWIKLLCLCWKYNIS